MHLFICSKQLMKKKFIGVLFSLIAHPLLSRSIVKIPYGVKWKLLSTESVYEKITPDTIEYCYKFGKNSIVIVINNNDSIVGSYSTNQWDFKRFYIPISLNRNVTNNSVLRKYPIAAIDINRLNDVTTSYNIVGDTLILYSKYPINNTQYIRYLKKE